MLHFLGQDAVDAAADADMAVAIAVNSKTEKYAVCNAIETLLVHERRADELLPDLAARYGGVRLIDNLALDEETQA